MAQPIFDEHPLHEYFRETGETAEPMPGGNPELVAEVGVDELKSSALAKFVLSVSDRIQIPPLVTEGISAISSSLFSPSNFKRPTTSFAERFKYDVISSSLLSTSLTATPHPSRRSFSPELPGLLDTGPHSRTSSTTAVEESHPSPHGSPISASDPGAIPQAVAIVSIAVLALAIGYEFLAMLLLAVALYVARAVSPTSDQNDVATLTLDAVSELIGAGNVWDSAVNEAMMIVEKEERTPSAYYGPTSPLSPISSLRVAIQSSLHTTQSQCDNVRKLLSALTSPTQLSQLSEMYAPASPIKSSFPSSDHPRPLSDPVAAWRNRTTLPANASPLNKRATWNGSYASMALAGRQSPLSPMKKREKTEGKRRSELTTFFNLNDAPSMTVSAPPSPLSQRILQDVQEEEDHSESELPYMKDDEVFGVAALDLQRKRRTSAFDVFGASPPNQASHLRHTPGHSSHHSLTSLSSPSRFTLLQTNRHPLSLSALHLALHGALSAKRYACAHLLALRFEEDADDEAYWEDARSVMALLTSTLTDASSRLMSALDDAEKRRMKDERPSTESLVGSSRESSYSPEPQRTSKPGRPTKTMAEMVSFAPMPNHLTRFAAHVDAISSALSDAREHLEQCVALLRDDSAKDGNVSMMPAADGSLQDLFTEGDENIENHALQAYDRLRKELGYALRECERGRERLLDAITASHPADPPEEEDSDLSSAVPPLGLDTSSDESTGLESPFAFPPKEGHPDSSTIVVEPSSTFVDDASEHLLVTASSHHLPPPGIEQVFEADSGGGTPFTRERSKMSREERIRLTKARRESGINGIESGLSSEPEPGSTREKWGPGGEVVQELKDVIWKVGEKRRKMTELAVPPHPVMRIVVDQPDEGSWTQENSIRLGAPDAEEKDVS
ncbi:hypothetical protein PHLCEN_2v3995 [Hermanssonia centrifuga]|uniref:Myosin-binding domain-containing protein n=1 Tax=Hermanssonia centrifuga TaxID=98765 RepID=A0A2R6Q7E0_9APHY|nr:hypothetical protein PHLCEN_2v3995 [Hermanssonia centrifuga]